MTVITGAPGSGKSRLIERLIAHGRHRRVAVIASAWGTGSAAPEGCVAFARTRERLTSAPTGGQCPLRSDLLSAVPELAHRGRVDLLLIESRGGPAPVAYTFAHAEAAGHALGDLTRLDTLVTVVDASSFLDDLAHADARAALGPNAGGMRTIAGALVEQVELADVIVVGKLDRVAPRPADW